MEFVRFTALRRAYTANDSPRQHASLGGRGLAWIGRNGGLSGGQHASHGEVHRVL